MSLHPNVPGIQMAVLPYNVESQAHTLLAILGQNHNFLLRGRVRREGDLSDC